MPRNLPSVLHIKQKTEADCLPVCVQMILDYLDIKLSYRKLIDLLGTKWYGTPFENIKRIEQFGVTVEIERLALSEIESYILNNLPIITCVHTADLSYWSQAADHVVVVVGLDETLVYLNDPSLEHGQHPVPRVEFELAQLNYDHLCAIIEK